MSIEERALQQSADWPDQLMLGAVRARGLITFETGLSREREEGEASLSFPTRGRAVIYAHVCEGGWKGQRR